MGNSISLNIIDEDGHHVILNSQQRRTPNINTNSNPVSPTNSEISAHYSEGSSVLSSKEDVRSEVVSVVAETPRLKMRQCWICYGEEEIVDSVEFNQKWCSPCACRGTTKWVHQDCLLDWIDSQMPASSSSIVSNYDNNQATPRSTTNASNINTPTLPQHTPRFQTDGPLVLESVSLSCPQCHAVYKISESYALPRPILLAIDYLAKVKERFLLWSTFGLLTGSIYTIGFTYGMWNGWILGGEEFFQFLREAYDPATGGNILNRLQISAGIPLSPLFALSGAFSVFSWTFPLVPLFLVDGRHSISLSHPRGVLLAVPLIWSTHQVIVESLIPAIYRRILNKRLDKKTVPALNVTSNNISSEPTPVLNDPEVFEDAVSRVSATPTDNDEIDDSGTPSSSSTFRISILSTTASLLFPSTAAFTGWILSLLLPRQMSKISPFFRALIGAGVLVAVKDVSKLLYWYQTVRLRRFRRVLNRPEK